MADSLHQQLLNAIEARLKTIRAGQTVTVNGESYVYKTDVGRHVFVRLKRQLNPAIDFPCVDIIDDIDRIEYDGAPFGWQNNYLKITADCFTTGKAADLDGRKAYADIAACVGSDFRWGGLARHSSMAANPEDIAVEVAGNIICGTRVSFVVMYRSKQWQV